MLSANHNKICNLNNVYNGACNDETKALLCLDIQDINVICIELVAFYSGCIVYSCADKYLQIISHFYWHRSQSRYFVITHRVIGYVLRTPGIKTKRIDTENDMIVKRLPGSLFQR